MYDKESFVNTTAHVTSNARLCASKAARGPLPWTTKQPKEKKKEDFG